MGLGDYVRAARIAAGLKLHKEETMLNLWITLRKALLQLAVIFVGAVGAVMMAPETVAQVTAALQSIPFGDQIGLALCGFLAAGLANIAKRLLKIATGKA
jgi:hypothetical protein